MEKYTFCNEGLINECISYISKEVTYLGLPPACTGEPNNWNLVDLINCLDEVLQLFLQKFKISQELKSSLHWIQQDFEQSQILRSQLQKDLNQSEQVLSASKEEERQLLVKVGALSVAIKSEQDEVKRLTSSLQRREVQCCHETRKIDAEIGQLKDRLDNALRSNSHSQKLGSIVINNLKKTDRRWLPNKQSSGPKHKIHDFILSGYEANKNDLVVVKEQWQDLLHFLHKQLCKIISQLPSIEEDTDSEDSLYGQCTNTKETQNLTLLPELFRLPYANTQHKIESVLNSQLLIVRKFLQWHNESKDREDCNCTVTTPRCSGGIPFAGNNTMKLEPDSPDMMKITQQDEVRLLREKLKQYEDIIEEQEETMWRMLTKLEMEDSIGDSLREKEQLMKERYNFLAEKAAFEAERSAYTDASERLQKEHEQLQRDTCNHLKQYGWNLKTPSAKKVHRESVATYSPAMPVPEFRHFCNFTPRPRNRTISRPDRNGSDASPDTEVPGSPLSSGSANHASPECQQCLHVPLESTAP